MITDYSPWKVGDRIQIGKDNPVAGTVTSVTSGHTGNLGVDWDDGDTTLPGMLHPFDVAAEMKE
jgi:hypothetical protein